MRLTSELVARMARHIDDPGEEARPDVVWCTDADRDEAVTKILAERPPSDDFWVFAYGSLIWNPAFEFVERPTGVVRGFHRSFCLGWIERFRGSAEYPGLMMALDHGGQCEGVAYRLPPDEIKANLGKLFRREMLVKPDPMLPIWVDVETERGSVRALTFVIDREGRYHVGGLSVERTAEVLALAAGHVGSMADYLYQTVRGLEDLKIHDEHLWQLQELVAERIEKATVRR
ncbi:MAG TPA: gamma-glutamylcyclotransferase [Rhodothermia bacterium]|nr:gamma-glutamylcyclotransferase [Rhodothermia bacterium]